MQSLSPEQLKDFLASLSDEEAQALLYDWRIWGRPDQQAPGGYWRTWLIRAGRGWGKTRTGAEWVVDYARSHPYCRIAILARTEADYRDVMIKGESGILAVSPPWFTPEYIPSQRLIKWPNGAQATTYSAKEPDLLRGPQHHAAWADELASWEYADETWANLWMGLRLGSHPQVVATTTPRPIRLIRELSRDKTTHVTLGSTFDNRANLPESFLVSLKEKYDGTRLGRQELYGEVLEDVPGALWSRAQIDALRVKEAPKNLRKIVVAIDPAVTSGEDSDMTGIVGSGKTADSQYYVLADRTCRESPRGWARKAINLFVELDADYIVAEVNNGGEMVEEVIRAALKPGEAMPPFKAVHASRGKRTRAEPIAALYEQGKVHHVGAFDALEDQQCTYTPDNYDGSPDRVDALVWGMTELSAGSDPATRLKLMVNNR